MEKRLYRSRTDRMIWGVCGGLAKYFEIDPVIVRLIAVLLIFASGVGILAYIVLAIIVPLESSTATEPRDVIKENVEEMKQTATQLGEDLRGLGKKEEEAADKGRQRSMDVLGIILIIVGIIFLLDAFNFFSFLSWRFLWPVIIIAIGLLIIFSVRRR